MNEFQDKLQSKYRWYFTTCVYWKHHMYYWSLLIYCISSLYVCFIFLFNFYLWWTYTCVSISATTSLFLKLQYNYWVHWKSMFLLESVMSTNELIQVSPSPKIPCFFTFFCYALVLHLQPLFLDRASIGTMQIYVCRTLYITYICMYTHEQHKYLLNFSFMSHRICHKQHIK